MWALFLLSTIVRVFDVTFYVLKGYKNHINRVTYLGNFMLNKTSIYVTRGFFIFKLSSHVTRNFYKS